MKTIIFHQALKFVSHAMAVKDIRHYLNGVCFEFGADTLTMVGTDGHRIAIVTVLNCEHQFAKGTQYIIPSSMVKALIDATKKTNALVRVVNCASNAGRIEILLGDAALIVRPIDGKFPAWRRVDLSENPLVPTEAIGLDANYIAAAFKACGALTTKGHNATRMELFGADNGVLVSTVGPLDGIQNPHVVAMPMKI